jgi:Tfp pilus assembly PilM family ATPase
VKSRWPLSKKKHKFKYKSNHSRWVGISVSSLTPSAVIYSKRGIVDSITYDQEQGIEALELWLKKRVRHGMPAVLVLDDDEYELLLVDAPNVPDDELNAAMEFRIGDLLAQPVEESAIQAMRLPRDAYRGRMSMAHVIACPNENISARVNWAKKQNLAVKMITVPELSLLNVLAASSVDQGIALLELGFSHGCIRLYKDGALYLTRKVEMGLSDLDINDNECVSKNNDQSDVNLEYLKFDDTSKEYSFIDGEVDLSELQLKAVDDELIIDQDAYVGFSPKTVVSDAQVRSLVLEVQRSLDYYESQLGMGQITQLWIMAGGVDLTPLVDAMQPALAAYIEQPDIAGKLVKKSGVNVSGNINDSVKALGGALAYVAR